jgi:8-hydroxy-5-deazaflavin:NADPH oxidoreductase
MKIGVLGTGMVGRMLGSKLVELGHEVSMGSRDPDNEDARAWAAAAGETASAGIFAEAAEFGEVVFNCTAGMHSVEALDAAGAENLDGKVLIDVANSLDFSQGRPPTLGIVNTESLGERIQAAHPEARVVKALNTVNCEVMVDPAIVPGDHVIFVCGDDEGAKAEATRLLGGFGWPGDRVIDLGDISQARGPEMYLPLWLRLMGPLDTIHFNIALHRAPSE